VLPIRIKRDKEEEDEDEVEQQFDHSIMYALTED